MKLAGIDEAGRGPVLGPMVIAAVVVDEGNVPKLEELGVKDSKKLTPKRRERLFDEIVQLLDDYVILELWPEEIDSREGTLNEFEVENFVKALNSLKVKPDVVYIDAADVKEARFGEEIKAKLDFEADIIAEHKADDKFVPVSAASILAKVARDRAIEKLKDQYGEIGSGYPSDPRTRTFLEEYYRKHGEFPPIVRRTWKTLKKIEEKLAKEMKKRRGQTSLEEFFGK
ncbi:ribonuclease HII [Thermococcus onnurineus NA1]|uniref:Ribonuclease HII n=1 Tax=Thermococcus onnurineus (strain NA1) TaxID=523850 RepID=RNH2_THEON|nr:MULTISPECIES: ribonuclease HII [Thermococcus]B6YVT5.1 RecName: Full=Ribonuclease HII; Short=RNase HII [Thermococcus onnurineus NA1]ACJ16258.1 ribonuclease HII [Thermococcus onnurineus NA1]NJE47216.1 ribonuclease HII [Thermococcus sp. GR7]NJE79009.1 ribonuclease HII [Thermococcus sp. GR4]NJF22619.1 ribonuclease HII [Thermococcus sp. GR5]